MIFNGQYLTYAEYQSLGGTLDEVPFNILEIKARGLIDEKTMGRLHDLEEQRTEVKATMFELINNMSVGTAEKAITSENIDGYSVSYANKTTQEQRLVYDDIIRSNLLMCKLEDGTPYLYCGVD